MVQTFPSNRGNFLKHTFYNILVESLFFLQRPAIDAAKVIALIIPLIVGVSKNITILYYIFENIKFDVYKISAVIKHGWKWSIKICYEITSTHSSSV